MTSLKPTLLRAKQAAEYLSISRSLFYELVQEGLIPKGTQIRKRCVVWRVADLNQHPEKFIAKNEVSNAS